ncbi:hypothetical protein ACT7DN_04565 [Bacillus paranthracis]
MRYKDYVVFYGEIGTVGIVKAKEFETEEHSEEVDIKLDWYEDDEEGLKKDVSYAMGNVWRKTD